MDLVPGQSRWGGFIIFEWSKTLENGRNGHFRTAFGTGLKLAFCQIFQSFHMDNIAKNELFSKVSANKKFFCVINPLLCVKATGPYLFNIPTCPNLYALLLCFLKNGELPFTKYEYMISWLYLESIFYYLYLKASFSPTIKWREGKFRLKWGTRAIKMDENNNGRRKKSTSPSTSPLPSKIMLNEQDTSSCSSSSSASLNTKQNKNLEKLIIVPETTTNSKLAHKRTNSYIVVSKSVDSQQQQHQTQIIQLDQHTDIENSNLLSTTCQGSSI